MAKNQQKEKSSNRNIIRWIIIILIILLAVYLFGRGGFGNGGSRGSNTGDTNTTQITGEQAGMDTIDIRVNEDSIYWNNESITNEELENRLADLEEGTSITLIDDNAILSTYETVQDALEQHSIQATETIQE
ncbi:hypothetical protein CL176_04350 [Suicoccus acidiformans]|uniref:Uncharacterized protein n=1 Tax=Suicoccus acidiformans TaxID=2036206 RepID=A0A347WJN1_9LACT|nr:hypothetical protein [Suicoccus acidiformans]AXY25288.1 hypothetical protein CL176_04350 [Suicoccus acidiformans]